MTDHALRLLRENPRLAALAEFPFDFSLDRAEYGHGEPVRLVSGGSLEVVAGDAGGGTYFVCEDGSVLYADSEGSAGLVGSGFDEAFEIMIGLGGEDDLDEEEEEYYGYEAARAELRAALGFPERSREALEALLDAAQARTWPDFLLLNAEEGCAYELIGPPPPPLWERVPVPGGFEGDPASEPLYTWTDLALAQGRTNLARAALIQRFDAIYLDQGLLRRTDDPTRLDTAELTLLADNLERVGEPLPAERARRLHAALRETPDGSGTP
ncbi:MULTISPECIES: hypothetical protein [unclassified Streptomyces]|uniref:hypothetical protein n=1 Tax=unclassified Streptomyces TaxID=2593676 RepID=UPI002252967C|nr:MULTISPECIES: hypothetical protein [unclassified Streptomyces]MCX5330614.1 hypothetical protein [Streptomyces sp. NBC_00140]MCX5360009.1 hypothetical protein [Streptomyces sp. NBC_00124]